MMDDTERRDAMLAAMLPNVPFDGWTRAAMRAAASRAGIDEAELSLLFPRGPRDAAAWFSRWADRKMISALHTRRLGRLRTPERIAEAVKTRLQILLPHREAARRSLSLMALPRNVALGTRLLYETVDAIWHEAGDRSTDFNFYTKRGLLAGIYTATMLYWLDDRSEGARATSAFLDRRLAETLVIPRLLGALSRLPNPLRVLRAARGVL